MKSMSKLFRILSLAIILSLLVFALPATPVLAYSAELSDTEGRIGDTIDITGDGYPEVSPPTVDVFVYFAREKKSVNTDISDMDAYEEVTVTTAETDGTIDDSFDVPSELTWGSEDEKVRSGTYYVYTTIDEEGAIKTRNTFTVIAAEITLDPDKAAVGAEVEITGTEFGDSTDITVQYDGEEIDIESGDTDTDSGGDFTCTIIIPESIADTHTILVTDDEDNEAEAEFTVEPELTLTTTRASPGDSVTTKGTGFGADLEVTIKFGGEEVATEDTDSDGSFEGSFTVPVKSPATYKVEAKDTDNNKDTVDFTVAAGIKVSPTSGNVGSQVTVSGAGFQPNSSVTITYAPETAPVATATADAVGKFSSPITVPKSRRGSHTITATDGVSTVTATFTMESTAPPIPTPLLPLMADKASRQAEFDWEDVTDPSGVTYTLQIATNTSFTSDSIVFQKAGITTSAYTLTKEERLKSTTKEIPYYYWRVRAVDGAENESGWTTPGSFYCGFSLDFSGWALYVLIAIGVILLLLIGYLVGRRISYSQ